MKAVICDIDGTLSDPTHRLHYVTGASRDWPVFFAAMGNDLCHEPIASLVDMLRRVVLCTGRPEEYREATEKWLQRFAIGYSAMYMRPTGDHRADHVVKREMLDRIRADGYEPWLVIDDRPSVVAMWREAGLTCLQCRDWDERSNITPGLLTLMVGPSGAGKTTWLAGAVAQMFGIHSSHVVSSDQIRNDVCGDWRDQTRNDDVFAALHAVVKARVTHGLPTVVDATNLRRKDRMTVVDLAPPDAPVRYVVIDRPLEEKQRDAGRRAELSFDLIAKHDQTFRSQLKDILAGDGRPNVTVIDLRRL